MGPKTLALRPLVYYSKSNVTIKEEGDKDETEIKNNVHSTDARRGMRSGI
jgi:hypothetical protein